MGQWTCRWGVGLMPVVVLAAVLAGVARAAPEAGFLHIRRNLSETEGLMSAYPDLAVSADGNWVAVAWVDGYNTEAGYRGHVYLRAASETSGWGNKVQVYSGSSAACAYLRASLAIAGTTAHLAYVVFEDCASGGTSRVYYQTCSLPGGTCGSREQVASAAYPPYQITWVDLALDAGGNPHVVWPRYYSGAVSQVFYKSRGGSGWPTGDGERVDTLDNRKNNTPAIAWGGGYAHVVWENETDHKISYRRRGASGWFSILDLYTAVSYPPHNPDVAAGAGRVFVAWDVLQDNYDIGYALLYRRSNTNGQNFSNWQEVGTDQTNWSSLTAYCPTGDTFLSYLRPAMTLDSAGWPTVVWHAASNGGLYAVYYTSAVTGTETDVSWSTPAVLHVGRAGAATVGVGQPGGERHLHVAYMEGTSVSDREVYYDSNEADRYPHVYLPLVLRNASFD